MAMKYCVLYEGRICNDCKDCHFCDLDPDKLCDNCMECLEEPDCEFASIYIDAIVDEDGNELMPRN